MMSTRANPDVRKRRRDALRPLFAELDAQGRSRVWLGRQLGIDRKSIYAYQLGENRIPADFVERACKALGVTASIVHIGDSSEMFIQRPRARRASQTRKGASTHASSEHNTSHTSSSNTHDERAAIRRRPVGPASDAPDGRADRKRHNQHGSQQQPTASVS